MTRLLQRVDLEVSVVSVLDCIIKILGGFRGLLRSRFFVTLQIASQLFFLVLNLLVGLGLLLTKLFAVLICIFVNGQFFLICCESLLVVARGFLVQFVVVPLDVPRRQLNRRQIPLVLVRVFLLHLPAPRRRRSVVVVLVVHLLVVFAGIHFEFIFSSSLKK